MGNYQTNNWQIKTTIKELRSFIIDNQRIIDDESEIAATMNEVFKDTGLKLAQKIPKTNKSYNSYLQSVQMSFQDETLTMDEFERDFGTIKNNKATGYDEISGNIIMKVLDEIKIVSFSNVPNAKEFFRIFFPYWRH